MGVLAWVMGLAFIMASTQCFILLNVFDQDAVTFLGFVFAAIWTIGMIGIGSAINNRNE